MGNKLRRSDVAQRYRVSTRTIERWTADADYADLNFPKPIRYGKRSPLYDLDELIEWERARAEAQAKAQAEAQAKPQAKPQAKAKAIDLAIDLDEIIEEAAAA